MHGTGRTLKWEFHTVTPGPAFWWRAVMDDAPNPVFTAVNLQLKAALDIASIPQVFTHHSRPYMSLAADNHHDGLSPPPNWYSRLLK
jgi:hypothetical protein